MTDPSESDDLSYEASDGDTEDDGNYASVVQIDRHEDVASVCGRIDTATSYAVVIHAPGGNRALSREIGMRRVIRHAEESGKAIAFATGNRALASRARALRIPVARKPEHVRWDAGGRVIVRLPGRSIAVPAFGRVFQLLVIAGIGILLIALLFTAGPSVTVIAYPASDTLESVLTVHASESVSEVDLDTLDLPAERVTAARTVTIVIPTTGTAQVGVEHAAVTVTATNTTSEEVVVPEGARVRAELDDGNIEFELDDELELAPGATDVVMATALTPGVRGNIPPETITGFVDPELSEIVAMNAGNGAGGEDGPAPAVDQEDIARLRDTADLLETAASIQETIVSERPRDAILVGTGSVRVERGEPSENPGTPAEIVSMDVTVTVTALAIVEAVWNEVAPAILDPDGEAGEFIPGSVIAVETNPGQAVEEEGVITSEFRIRAEFAPDTTAEGIADAVKGSSPEEARSILESRYGIDDPEIDLWPGWAPRLPRFDFRIDVDLRSRENDESALQATATTSAGTP